MERRKILDHLLSPMENDIMHDGKTHLAQRDIEAAESLSQAPGKRPLQCPITLSHSSA